MKFAARGARYSTAAAAVLIPLAMMAPVLRWWILGAGFTLLAVPTAAEELQKRWARQQAAAARAAAGLPAATTPAPQYFPVGATSIPHWPVELMRGVISEKAAGNISMVLGFIFLCGIFAAFPMVVYGVPLGWVLATIAASVVLTVGCFLALPFALVNATSAVAARRLRRHVGSLPAKLNEDARLRQAIEMAVTKALGRDDAVVALEIADSFEGTVDELIVATRVALAQRT